MVDAPRARRATRSLLVTSVFCVPLLTLALVASAQGRFGAHDVRTVFFVAKSDDRNRVDYAIALDADCQPSSDQPIYPYWRRFEPGQPVIGELNTFDLQAYGIERQAVRSRADNGSWTELTLRQLPRRILVLSRPRPGGGCMAEAYGQIDGRHARLTSVFVQLGLISVSRISIRGEDARDRSPIVEHLDER